MALNWYRRLKLGFDLTSSRYYISKIIAPKPPLSITSHTNQFRSTFSNNNNNNNNNQQSLIRVTKVPSLLKISHFGSSYGNRCYHTSQQSTGTRKNNDGFLSRLCLLTAVHLGLITIMYGHVETVPYTKRIQFLLMPSASERKVGVDRFERIKDGYKGKVLAEIDPESVRVRKILNDVVEALEIGLMKKHKGVKLPGLLELLLRSPDSNSKGLEWEILVVKNDDAAYACCLPGGKFVVFTGLLERFNTDEEIAAIIAHEVSHVVARHVAEKFTNKYYWCLLVVFIYNFIFLVNSDLYCDSSLDLPFSPRMEIEADDMGLMLMAFAGYDPRVAPKVFEKMGQALGDSAFHDYLSIQPSRQTRSELISEFSGIMQEAISIYEEAKVGVQLDT